MKLTILFLISLTAQLWAQPRHILFTYTGDTATSLTVNWQSVPGKSSPVVYYDTESRSGNAGEYSYQSTGKVFQIPGLNDRSMYRVSIDALKPATSYYLVVGDAENGFSSEIKVKTLPDDDRPIRFVTGGDMGVSGDTRILLRNAASFDPDFAVIGGDIAYVNGNVSEVVKWDTWLDYYCGEMITSDDYAIPLVLAIGNHEVNGAYNQPKSEAPFFFGLFGQDEDKSYFSRQFGLNLVLFVLDSGHIATHESQTKWLNKAFSEYKDLPHKAAVYHVPLYPSHRDFMGMYSDLGRQHWAPIFDDHGLTVAFENHDHTFKRSHIIKDGVPSEDGNGTLYLGDGCWGRNTREIHYPKRPYLKLSGNIQHFWVVDCDAEKMTYRAVDIENEIFDVYPENEPEARAATERFDSKEMLHVIPSEMIEIQNDEYLGYGGDFNIRVKNHFSYPLTVQIEHHHPADRFRIKGLPRVLSALQPGEEHRVPVSFQLSEDVEQESLKRQRLVIHARAELHTSDSKEGIRFKRTYKIRLFNPEDE